MISMKNIKYNSDIRTITFLSLNHNKIFLFKYLSAIGSIVLIFNLTNPMSM